jgi:hypothetical protein
MDILYSSNNKEDIQKKTSKLYNNYILVGKPVGVDIPKGLNRRWIPTGDKNKINDLAYTISSSSKNAYILSALGPVTCDTRSNFVSDGNGTEELGNKLVSNLMDILRPLLEPVQVNYSNEVLANQINDISILLLILTIIIMVLIVGLLLNIFGLLYSDKILNYFNNKYIRGYLNFTKKFIALEVLLGGITILYFMYTLSLGIHFIATHPITFY